ncbi:hypothetical protein [Neobacillus soli]|uniref:hypothetical protein n=1 Tax=Neobacillus soli TaxID=220688 RepID=UPI000824E4B9|nr:hypothetical protein [Neobacillus soli]
MKIREVSIGVIVVFIVLLAFAGYMIFIKTKTTPTGIPLTPQKADDTYGAGDMKQKNQEIEDTLVGIVFDNAEQDARFRKLVGEDYSLFLDTFMIVTDEEDIDGFGSKVKGGFIRGLENSDYGVIMFNNTHMWAAVTHSDNDYNLAINYYTNDPKFKKKLPKTIKKYLPEGYDNIIYKSK